MARMARIEKDYKVKNVAHGIVRRVYSSQENDLRKSYGYDKILVN